MPSIGIQPSLDPALAWAHSGAMALTGEPGSVPRFARGPLATAASGAGRALAHLAPQSTLADLDAASLLGERAAIAGLSRRGRSSAGGSARLLDTRDGVIVVNLPRAEDWRLVPALLKSETAPSASDQPGAWNRLQTETQGRSRKELIERGRLMGLAVADAPVAIDAERPWFRLASESETAPPIVGRRIRLLDLSNLWAGPLAASLLAMAGIEVLKIENPERPDGARRGPKPFFDLMNANKDACALELKSAHDRALFESLLDAADIVLESARPRGLEQLGYSAATWTSSRAGRLWVSITGYGRDDPEREWIAYGDDAAIAAGLAWSSSPTSDATATTNSPCFCADAVADPLAGLHAAAITLALLGLGRGGVIDLSLVDICSRAAAFSAGPLEAPIEGSDEAGFLLAGDHPIPIEPPRARRSIGDAPKLAAPNALLLERWRQP